MSNRKPTRPRQQGIVPTSPKRQQGNIRTSPQRKQGIVCTSPQRQQGYNSGTSPKRKQGILNPKDVASKTNHSPSAKDRRRRPRMGSNPTSDAASGSGASRRRSNGGSAIPEPYWREQLRRYWIAAKPSDRDRALWFCRAAMARKPINLLTGPIISLNSILDFLSVGTIVKMIIAASASIHEIHACIEELAAESGLEEG